VSAINPSYLLTLGDHAYNDGTLSQYNSYYDPFYGQFKPKTKPSPGNHDYHTSGGSGYFTYFNNPPAYYSFNAGAWHIISLNGEVSVAEGSTQNNWLETDLANNTRRCILAYWHEPRWSAGTVHGDSSTYAPLWVDLYAARADVVLNGHDHNYQRFGLQTPTGAASADGIREFVVGTGGYGLYGLTSHPNLQASSASTYGALKMVLKDGSYDWQFVPGPGYSYTDSGSTACH